MDPEEVEAIPVEDPMIIVAVMEEADLEEVTGVEVVVKEVKETEVEDVVEDHLGIDGIDKMLEWWLAWMDPKLKYIHLMNSQIRNGITFHMLKGIGLLTREQDIRGT